MGEILKIVIGALVGVIFAEAYPSLKSFVKNWRSSFRDRQVKSIRNNYRRLKNFKEDQTALILEVLYLFVMRFHQALLVLGLGVLVVIVFTGRTTQSVALENTRTLFTYIPPFLFGFVSSDINDILRLIRKVRNFESFEKETIESLKKLGAL